METRDSTTLRRHDNQRSRPTLRCCAHALSHGALPLASGVGQPPPQGEGDPQGRQARVPLATPRILLDYCKPFKLLVARGWVEIESFIDTFESVHVIIFRYIVIWVQEGIRRRRTPGPLVGVTLRPF